MVDSLRGIAEKGMADDSATIGGPTIFDANSGYVMALGAKLRNIYAENKKPLTADDFELYRFVIRRLKNRVEEAFGLSLYFTAPTFISRLSGLNASWAPNSEHDEYWHPHVDRDNTPHYEYSGLLYLSDFGSDFHGGTFDFFKTDKDNTTALTIEPRRGRLLLFASTHENRHRVTKVRGGIRYALSFWFTCDPAFEFTDFLDGNAHLRFREQLPPMTPAHPSHTTTTTNEL